MPPNRRNRLPPISVNPILFVLFEPARIVTWLSPKKWLSIAPASYRPSRPYPPVTLPNQPCFIPSFIVRLITVSSSPSSTPVKRARSDFRSTTCSFSMMSTGRFLVATLGSSEKNSLPSTNILVISFPAWVIFPSLSTSTPGSFFNKSSTTELGCVL